MATLQCFATFKKVKLQCFTAFMVWRNDLYRATAKTHTKNYNLRTSQKTTNFCFSVLQHKRNSLDGEARVLTPAESFTVDGYDTATKTVCEYQGSYFHSCRKCFQNQRHETRNCHPDRTVEEKYQATLKKTAILRAAGYTVIKKWGCKFAKDKKTDPELQSFLKSFELVPPLDWRDAFFGGRTGVTTL